MIGRAVEVCPIILGVVDGEEIADLLVSHVGVGVRSQVADQLQDIALSQETKARPTRRNYHTDSM